MLSIYTWAGERMGSVKKASPWEPLLDEVMTSFGQGCLSNRLRSLVWRRHLNNYVLGSVVAVVRRAWKASAYRSESVAEPSILFVPFYHKLGGRRKKVDGDPNQSELLQKQPSRWLCWIREPAVFVFPFTTDSINRPND
jgi:hypothetical protein